MICKKCLGFVMAFQGVEFNLQLHHAADAAAAAVPRARCFEDISPLMANIESVTIAATRQPYELINNH